jgi:cation transport ATPase
MASKRKSRKRRTRGGPRQATPVSPPAEEALARGYARSRQRDEDARASLKPLKPGERPTAVTVGAVVAAVLAVANLIALAAGYNAGKDTLSVGSNLTGTFVVVGVLVLVAYGMWRARYWAVLGMQTLLALTMIFAALALLTAVSLWAALLVLIILGLSGTLFWFLVKAMARIQMPERPGS